MVVFGVEGGGGSPAIAPSPSHGDYPPQRDGHVVFDLGETSATEESVPNQYRVSSFLDRARHVVARFGRLTGMHFPGISYSSLRNESDSSNADHRRRPIGGGINQDGVFSNLNAKPEGARRPIDDPNDRGDDDDLADDTLPPTYEVAAADVAPTYWESTVFGGNPLADNEGGWTSESSHVGDPWDLIEDGMLLGTIFGFVWNLFVSASFQFVGFILTFLLHTTHAAKLGSRMGLGITLAQYASTLLFRLAEARKKAEQHKSDSTTHRSHMPSMQDLQHSRAVCYAMLIFGSFLILQSSIKYALMYRKAIKLVAAARREQGDQPQLEESQSTSRPPTGFIQALRSSDPASSLNEYMGRWRDSLFSDFGLVNPVAMHTAEDYIIRPGHGMDSQIVFTAGEDPLAQHISQFVPSTQRGRGLSNPFPDYMYPTEVDELESEAHSR